MPERNMFKGSWDNAKGQEPFFCLPSVSTVDGTPGFSLINVKLYQLYKMQSEIKKGHTVFNFKFNNFNSR